MFYTIYKITNIIDNKIYIGAHKTNDLFDGYFGSGKYLINAINKHGIENFKKEIMQLFPSTELMYEMESLLVSQEFVNRSNTYNLKIGGEGGFDYLNKNNLENVNKDWEKIGLKISNSLKGKNHSLSTIKAIKESHKYRKPESYGKGFTDRKHTKETIQKMKKSAIGKHDNKLNSQYGTCWIYNKKLKQNKKISKIDLNNWINNGWLKGRKGNDKTF